MLGSVRGVVSNDHSYRDKANPRVPTLFRARKATRFGRTIARSERPGVVEEPGMCRSSLDGNREIPRLASCGALLWPASGRRGAVADDERTWEVRLRNSSWEADEQSRATGCGVGGAKCGGRGECEPAKHAPGAGPGKCVTARSRTCTPGSIREHIGLCRLGDITYRRLMVSSARSQLPHSKTRSSRRRHAPSEGETGQAGKRDAASGGDGEADAGITRSADLAH